MKKTTYTLGFLFTLTLVFGAFFKFAQWPNADILMLIGVTGHAVLFIPLLQFSRQNVKMIDAWKNVLGAIGIALVFWFDLLRWPGAGELAALGVLIFGFGFLPIFFFKQYKKSLQA